MDNYSILEINLIKRERIYIVLMDVPLDFYQGVQRRMVLVVIFFSKV